MSCSSRLGKTGAMRPNPMTSINSVIKMNSRAGVLDSAILTSWTSVRNGQR